MDDRERAGGVLGALAAYPQVVVAVGRLLMGDYRPGGGVVIERKAAADLVASIRDQRLFDQAARLSEGTAHPAIILEGDPLAVRTGMNARAILDAHVADDDPGHPAPAEHRVGAHRRTPGDDRPPTAAGLERAVGRGQAEGPTPREQQMAVLAALPGVGPVLAARLLDHFGGLRGALDADAEALGAVPGIGDELAARLVALLR